MAAPVLYRGYGSTPPRRPSTVAVGGATRYAREHPGGVPGAPGAPATPWSAPPIPPGYYNPIRDIELAEGKRGTEQAVNANERERSNAENDFGVQSGLLDQRAANEATQHQQLLANIAESFKRLGVRQTEQANSNGVLFGGALLQSAMARSGNEGKQNDAENRNYGLQQQAIENARGELARHLEQLTGQGGSLTEALQNARGNELGFETSVGTLKAHEAATGGYEAPGAPKPKPKPAAKPKPISGKAALSAARRKARI